MQPERATWECSVDLKLDLTVAQTSHKAPASLWRIHMAIVQKAFQSQGVLWRIGYEMGLNLTSKRHRMRSPIHSFFVKGAQIRPHMRLDAFDYRPEAVIAKRGLSVMQRFGMTLKALTSQ
jgi:hypothetical protein